MNRFQHIEEPRLNTGMEPDGIQPRPTRGAPAPACHNTFGGGSSKATTSTQDRRIAAEGSTIATEDAMVTESGAIGLADGSQFLEAGAIGRDLGVGGDLSISSSDPDLVRDALAIYRDLSGQTAAVLAENTSEAHFLAGESGRALAEIKGAELSGGASLWRNTIIVIGLAALAVVGLFVWRKS